MKIFISYRRAEDNKSYIVGTIHEKLEKAFGREDVFRDTYDISGGANWRAVLEREMNSCKVMLVIIGQDWASLAYPDGQKRLFDPKDVTRWEVETGLRRSIEEDTTVIPVLVTGAEIPTAEDLPESLRPLLDNNVIRLRNFPDFDNDMEKLVRDIRSSRGYAEEDISTEYFEPKTIFLAEGPFWMGSEVGEGIPSHETPKHEVMLPSYRIGKYPVTNSQYEVFLNETGRLPPQGRGWDGQSIREGMENCPVMGVTWHETLAYCEWLSEKTGRQYTLPNEAQWEKACRGGGGGKYPWGDEFDPARANRGNSQIAPVDAFPAQNDYGLCDLVGNVRQWTTTLWGGKRTAPDPGYAYPWRADRRNDPSANRDIYRVVRGSSYLDLDNSCRCSSRRAEAPEIRGNTSFRVAISL